MPQKLFIVADGGFVGMIRTGNRGSTVYHVCLVNPRTGQVSDEARVNTGVPCQPSRELTEDSKNDFVHARRGVAAGWKAAATLRPQLSSLGLDAGDWPSEVTVCLRTNMVDRGLLRITQMADGPSRAEVQLVIGIGSVRWPGSHPSEPHEFDPVIVSVSPESSPVGLILDVLENAGEELVAVLSAQID